MPERFGDSFLSEIEMLSSFFAKRDIEQRAFVLDTWKLLKDDAKARKADPREPLERLYDLVLEANLFPDYSEEQINFRLIGWLAAKGL